jgi:hypothetical protein
MLSLCTFNPPPNTTTHINLMSTEEWKKNSMTSSCIFSIFSNYVSYLVFYIPLTETTQIIYYAGNEASCFEKEKHNDVITHLLYFLVIKCLTSSYFIYLVWNYHLHKVFCCWGKLIRERESQLRHNATPLLFITCTSVLPHILCTMDWNHLLH